MSHLFINVHMVDEAGTKSIGQSCRVQIAHIMMFNAVPGLRKLSAIYLIGAANPLRLVVLESVEAIQEQIKIATTAACKKIDA